METKKRRGRPLKQLKTPQLEKSAEEKIKIEDGAHEYTDFERAVNDLQPLIKKMVSDWNNGAAVIGNFKKEYFNGFFSGQTFQIIDEMIFDGLGKIDVPLRITYNAHFEDFKDKVTSAFREIERIFHIREQSSLKKWPLRLRSLRDWPVDDEGNICFDMRAVREEFDTYLTDPVHITLYKSLKAAEESLNDTIRMFKLHGSFHNSMIGLGLRNRLKYDIESDRYELDTTNLKNNLTLIVTK